MGQKPTAAQVITCIRLSNLSEPDKQFAERSVNRDHLFDELAEALDHALQVAELLHRTPVEHWQSKTDLAVCFLEDAQKYRRALNKAKGATQ